MASEYQSAEKENGSTFTRHESDFIWGNRYNNRFISKKTLFPDRKVPTEDLALRPCECQDRSISSAPSERNSYEIPAAAPQPSVIRRIEGDDKTKGGIIIPDTARRSRRRAKSSPSVPAPATKAAKTSAAERQGRRRNPLRQVVRHRGQDRWRGTPHRGVRCHGGARKKSRESGRLHRPVIDFMRAN